MFKRKQQQNNNIESKLLNVFDYLKSLSQEAKDLMDEIKDAKDDIEDGQLLFICSNKERFNFNTFNKPLNFISAICNSKISLKEEEISQRKLYKRIEELNGYRPENSKEKINGVLMQANDLLKYRDKIIDVFIDDTFLSEH